jgi:(1->4)-alpha-D-glucan 1-alpha-D-glucosylmutase
MTTPTATYRIQFRDGMSFEGAAAQVAYLRALGVSHLYASPIFAATPGSTHGYDVVDHNRLEAALGGAEGFEQLAAALRQEGLGLLLDIVPNHMGADVHNPWWRSVLEWGQESPYAAHFDIDWRERLTLPVLGRPFDEALAEGEIGLALDDELGVLGLASGGAVFPLAPPSYGTVLDRLAEPAATRIAELAREAVRDADRDTDRLHGEIRRILDRAADDGLQQALQLLSEDRTLLRQVHDEQPWRLLYWREARRHLSYRRFFEVTGLAGVRVEDEEVFADVHRLTLELVEKGIVDGLRIDHVDGLGNPRQYLERLRQAVGQETYLIVEKILGPDERIPADWPIAGTTGYEFIAALATLLVDEDRAAELDEVYRDAVGPVPDYSEDRREAKLEILCRNLETELAGLTRLAAAAAGAEALQLPEEELRQAIVELIVALPVYRLYGEDGGLPQRDVRLLEGVVAKVKAEAPPENPAALDFVSALMRHQVGAAAAQTANEFRRRFQQTSGPVMAKAVEDTLFYRRNRLLALNEVGGEPDHRHESPAAFHAQMAQRVETQPEGLLATATHDTKRGEDARARLYTLSEAPRAFADGVARWRTMQAALVQRLEAGLAPEPETEWLIYQALAGAWPLGGAADEPDFLAGFRTRFAAYLEKAMREAKTATSWSDVNPDYEQAVQAYAANLLAPDNTAFRADFVETLAPVFRAGALNSLTQLTLKLAAPGIPDVYQGCEGWDFSLVDPDNRRPVDFEGFAAHLAGLEAATPEDLLQDWESARIKQFVLMRGLRLRSRHHRLLTRGSYEPLAVAGDEERRVVALMRREGEDCVIAVVPRLTLALMHSTTGIAIPAACWSNTALSLPTTVQGRRFRDIFTGASAGNAATLPVADLLGRFPVSLLVAE